VFNQFAVGSVVGIWRQCARQFLRDCYRKPVTFSRAAGAADTLIAAYAVAHKQTIVTCDKGFLHISTALKRGRKADRLHVLHLAETGTITEIY
jgi:predicted nucleic acid-binding protein